MTDRQALIDAEDFGRRRAVAALLRGDSLDLECVPRRPNATLAAGLVLAALLAAGSAATSYVNGRAPSGWRHPGTLVLDSATGARFVVGRGGDLRPAPTLTSALLAGGGRPVLVPHHALDGVPQGPALADGGLPERPPALFRGPRPLRACATGRDRVLVDADASAPVGAAAVAGAAGPPGMLVRAPDATSVYLLSGPGVFDISADALLALGYSPAQVRVVPHAWLDLLAPAVPMVRLAAAPGEPSGGVAGVGAEGDVVAAAGSGRRYLVAGGALHPFVNVTSALLAPDPVRTLPAAGLLTAPAGPAVGLAAVPDRPPVMPPAGAEVFPCVRSDDRAVTATSPAHPGAPTRGVEIAGTTVEVTWSAPAGSGALMGLVVNPAGAADRRWVVADGVAYALVDSAALRALGYGAARPLLVAPSWLALTVPGATMRSDR